LSRAEPERPLFRFNSPLGRTIPLAFVFIVILTLALLEVTPIPVGAILFWSGFIAALLYPLIRLRNMFPKTVLFFDDRIELLGWRCGGVSA